MLRIALALCITLVACSGKAAKDPPAKDEPGKAASSELASSREPAGVTWKRVDRPFGSLEIPTGAGWEVVDNQVEGKDGTVIMLQSQDGISPDQIDDYLASYDDVQKRDAPKYVGTAPMKGTLAGAVAARVEGSFDNGTKFATRDFLVFAKGKVVMVSARTPASNAAALAGIVDHAARSLQIK